MHVNEISVFINISIFDSFFPHYLYDTQRHEKKTHKGAVEKENKPVNSNKASNTASTKDKPNSGKSAKSGASNQNGQQNNRNDRGPREG